MTATVSTILLIVALILALAAVVQWPIPLNLGWLAVALVIIVKLMGGN